MSITTTTEIRCDSCKKSVLRFTPSPTQPFHKAIDLGWNFDPDTTASCPKCIEQKAKARSSTRNPKVQNSPQAVTETNPATDAVS